MRTFISGNEFFKNITLKRGRIMLIGALMAVNFSLTL